MNVVRYGIFSVADPDAGIPDGVINPGAPALPLAGPLFGLLSVHRHFPSNDLLLLACDMLDLDQPTIGKMITAYRDDDRYDFYIYEGAAFDQPFCGIYTSSGLRRAYAQAVKGELEDFRLRSLFTPDRTKKIGIDRAAAFANYNSL